MTKKNKNKYGYLGRAFDAALEVRVAVKVAKEYEERHHVEDEAVLHPLGKITADYQGTHAHDQGGCELELFRNKKNKYCTIAKIQKSGEPNCLQTHESSLRVYHEQIISFSILYKR